MTIVSIDPSLIDDLIDNLIDSLLIDDLLIDDLGSKKDQPCERMFSSRMAESAVSGRNF